MKAKGYYKIGTSTSSLDYARDDPEFVEGSLECHGERSRTVGILSLGCPRNIVDSENILGRLKYKGYPIVDMNEADVAIINTCAFIEDAKRESVDTILDLLDLKKKGKLKKIIVYGCLSQRYKEVLAKELPEIDAFVGRISLNHSLKSFSITPKHYAYLKICEGCINNCSYCIIPRIKGRFTSLKMDSVVDRVEELNRKRISELNIIGQDITGYGIDLDKTHKLTELLRKILKTAKNIGWIRLLYLYPRRVSDELLTVVACEPKICKYIDLPVQHINDRILRLMRRRTTRKDILDLIEKIRKIIPDVAIRTSLIVGFPSETDKEFKELLEFVKDARFERLGAFIYSAEEGTSAYSFKGQIPQRIKMGRFNEIMSCQQKVSRDINKNFLGRILDVLIDEKEKDCYLGRTQYDAPQVDGLVYVSPVRKNTFGDKKFSNGVSSKKRLGVGDFVKVKITDTLEYDLVGEVLEENIFRSI